MSEIETFEQQALWLKQCGHTTMFSIRIDKFLEIAEKAKRYDAMPQVIKDAAQAVQQ